jgi:hypothetical protein
MFATCESPTLPSAARLAVKSEVWLSDVDLDELK